MSLGGRLPKKSIAYLRGGVRSRHADACSALRAHARDFTMPWGPA